MATGELYINGGWVPGNGLEFTSTNPADGSEIWRGRAASPADVDQAARAARAAFELWGTLPFADRESCVRRFGNLLEASKDALAVSISRDTGKPLWETRTEVTGMINKIEISVHAYQARTGLAESGSGDVHNVVRHKPHGVVAVFGPYNFPGHLPGSHIVPALLAGNCVLFKPSEQTPLVGEETMRLWSQAGLPEGVIHLLQGGGPTGEAIAAHPEIDGLYFTGSARVGHLLHRQFADAPHKILALEMGGNNPLVVGEVDDVKAAVYHVIQSAYLTSGQRCTCARRLLVAKGAAGDVFIATLATAIGKIRVGAYDAEPQPFMGPMISAQAAEQLLQAQQKLIKKGAVPRVQMKRLALGPAFLSPGLLDVTKVKDLPDEEYFGPLLCLIRYDTLEEAIQLANRTRYGLAAGLLSERAQDWELFFKKIRAGVVNWNRQITGASAAAPFGGIGASGNHRPSAYYAADYCAYPVASAESHRLQLPEKLTPGLEL